MKTLIESDFLVSFWYKCCEEYGWAKVIADGIPRYRLWQPLGTSFFHLLLTVN